MAIILSDEQIQSFEEKNAAFRNVLESWKINRADENSPLINESPEVKNAIVKGYEGLIRSFQEHDTKENLPTLYRKKQHVEWAAPAANMMEELELLLEDVQQARNLAAGVISQASRDYHSITGRGITVRPGAIDAVRGNNPEGYQL